MTGVTGELVMMMLDIGPMSISTLVSNLGGEFNDKQIRYAVWHLYKAGKVTRSKPNPESDWVYQKVRP